jgi:competence protein ComEC
MAGGRTALIRTIAGSPAAVGTVVLSHPRHVVLFAVLGGLLLGPFVPATVLGAAGLAAAVVLSVGRVARGRASADRQPSHPWTAEVAPDGLALGVGLALLAGAVTATARLEATDGERLAARTGQRVTVSAVLLEPVRQRVAGPAVARVRLTGGALDGEVGVVKLPHHFRAHGRPGVGEIVEVFGVVEPLSPFDAYQRPRGASAAVAVAEWRRTGRRRGGVAGILDAVRRRAERGLEHGLRRDEANLLRGMVLGQDERLEEEVRTDFQRSGLAHLLAVSGQNVMLLVILVLAVAGVVGVPRGTRLLIALAVVAAYVPLAGGGPSIQRAGVMGAAGLVAAMAGRPASRWYAVGLAGTLTLLMNPRAAGEPGWQLSFAAVIALLVLARPLRDICARAMPGPVAEAAAMTVAATIGTAPLLALHFGELSVVSLPANLLAAPAVAPIMWLGMLSTAVAQVSAGLAAPLNALDGPLLAYLAALARGAGSLPNAVLPVTLRSAGGIAAACIVPAALSAGILGLRRRLPPRGGPSPLPPRARTALLAAGVAGAIGVAVLVAVRASPPAFRAGPGELAVTFLDVGQGDATLVQSGEGTSVLFDGGPPEAGVLRELRRAGVRHLDVVVATHQSRDHQGGLHDVIDRLPTRLLLENGDGTQDPDFRRLLAEADARGIRRLPARAGQVLRLGPLVIRVLAPAPRPHGVPPPEEPNPRGVAAVVSHGTFDLWLSADAESEAILPLPLRPVEAMKVSHHGSADPGLPEVLARLRPEVATIPVGARNGYGHPAPETVAALTAAVPNVFRTDRDGSVVLKARGGRVSVRSDR